jgi:hypothetical protein
MATGIVSVAIRADGQEALSLALLVLTAIAWVLLAAVGLHRVCFDRQRWREEAQQVASLTAVAGTAILGVRLTLLGWSWAGWTLLAIATTLCLTALSAVRKARALPGTGAAFLVVVAPQSLTVLAASALREDWRSGEDGLDVVGTTGQLRSVHFAWSTRRTLNRKRRPLLVVFGASVIRACGFADHGRLGA